jgi:hypothetical protein
MNEAEIEATEITPEHSLYTAVSGAEKARLYRLGFVNAGQRLTEMYEHYDYVIASGADALTDYAENYSDHDKLIQLTRSTYFASVHLISIANQSGKRSAIERATQLHAVVVSKLKIADLLCPGFTSYPARCANLEWRNYYDQLKPQSLTPEIYAEYKNCSYSFITAQNLFAYDSTLKEWASDRECCDDHNDNNNCWYCSYDN